LFLLLERGVFGFLGREGEQGIVPTKMRESLLMRKFKDYAIKSVSCCSSILPVSCCIFSSIAMRKSKIITLWTKQTQKLELLSN